MGDGWTVTLSPDGARLLRIPGRDERHRLPGGMWEGPSYTLAQFFDEAPTFADAMRRAQTGGSPPPRVHQLRAWAEMSLARGGVVRARVGSGKSLILLLSPLAMDVPYRKAALIVPGDLRDAMIREWVKWSGLGWPIPDPRKHWGLFASYEQIAHPANADLPERPGILQAANALAKTFPALGEGLLLLCLDEVHVLASGRAAKRGQAIYGWLGAERQKHGAGSGYPTVVEASGTAMRKRLSELVHLAGAPLRDRAPVPFDRTTLAQWEYRLGMIPERERPFLPPNVRVCPDLDSGSPLMEGFDTPAAAFQHLLRKPVGVVDAGGEGSGCDASLDFYRMRPEVPEAITKAIEGAAGWQLPDGREITTVTEKARAMRTLALGYWLRPVEEPDREWDSARREWARRAEELAGRAMACNAGLNAPALVEKAMMNGEWPGPEDPVFERWAAVRNRARPEWLQRKANWVKGEEFFLWNVMKAWLRNMPKREGGVAIWTASPHVGRTLAGQLGCPYFGGEGEGGDPEAFRGVLAVLSAPAHGRGKNLQHFSAMAVLDVLASSAWAEQLIGRAHRQGQTADAVRVWWASWARVQEGSLAAARAASVRISAATGDGFKLLEGTWVDGPPPDAAGEGGWAPGELEALEAMDAEEIGEQS